MVVQEELDCINIEDIGNFEDSPRLVFINEECGNLIEINDGGKLAININQKTKSDVLQQPIDVYSVTNIVGKSIYLETM